jgi:hypothetical protein
MRGRPARLIVRTNVLTGEIDLPDSAPHIAKKSYIDQKSIRTFARLGGVHHGYMYRYAGEKKEGNG